MKKIFLLLLLALGACAHNTKFEVDNVKNVKDEKPEEDLVVTVFDTPKTINEAVHSPFRTPLFKERDIYRHPIDTLTFFNIKPTMNVLEVTPVTPWYSEILGPFLNDRGQYIMATQRHKISTFESNNFIEWSKRHPEIAKNMKSTTFDLLDPVQGLGEDSSVDAVLTFRNIHEWIASGNEDLMFKAFFKVLKQSGILGVVEHRAPKEQEGSKAALGYVREADVIKIAKKAGFKYLGRSEVNGNPKDTKDYEKGVWSLPPKFANKDKDREKYMEIGESDRMTLKFIKP